jgi:putative acetyltransferase
VILDSAPPLEVVRELFEEYSRQIGVDLCVQNFTAELAGLPGNYDLILVARDGDSLAGCAALRPFPYNTTQHRVAELKRLYVRDQFRGLGLGRRLTEAMIQEAARRGYRSLRLDTLATMAAAISMYRSMGFEEFEPERPRDFPGQLFFRIDDLSVK